MNHIKAITYLLDDEWAIGEFIKEITLKNDNLFDLTCFTNPDDFLAALNNKVNLVILDKYIPGYDYDVYETINYLHVAFPGIYIIVISGSITQDFILCMLRMEVFDVIEKNHNWTDQLKKSFDRVTPRILHKLNALNA